MTNRRRQPVPPTSATRPAIEPRQYAEAWYQCLREPQTHTVPLLTSTSSGFGTYVRDLDVGHWRSGGGQTYVITPAGDRDERAIGRVVYDMMGSNRPDDVLHAKLLGRVITGVSMTTLVRPGGWEKPRERAIRYALACLTLAVQLDDRQAEEPLRAVRLML